MITTKPYWHSVEFAGVPIDHVSDLRAIQSSIGLGDGFRLATEGICYLYGLTTEPPKCSVVTSDLATALSLVVGTIGTLTATYADTTVVPVGSSEIVIVNAVLRQIETRGIMAGLAEFKCGFEFFSGDGVTNPISFTRP